MNIMAGTLSPEQLAAEQRQKAIVDALRGMQAPQQAPAQQGGRVVSAGALGDGLSNDSLSGIGKGIGGLFGNLGTAFKYDTNPFSQQTAMLMNQDKGF